MAGGACNCTEPPIILENGFYDFRAALPIRLDSRETFTVHIALPSWVAHRWKLWKKRCPVCSSRRGKREGTTNWMKHIDDCRTKRPRSRA